MILLYRLAESVPSFQYSFLLVECSSIDIKIQEEDYVSAFYDRWKGSDDYLSNNSSGPSDR